MKRPNQALIAAGGYGSRLKLKPAFSKSLLQINGQTLLAVLLSNLYEVGIKDFVIATHKYTEDLVRKEVTNFKKGAKDVKIHFVCSEGGFRKIPSAAKDLLEERFLFVCGHHALPTNYLYSMLEASKDCLYVLSGYSNKDFPLSKERRIVFENSKIFYAKSNFLKKDHMYVRNPFIIDKEVVLLSEEANFANPFSAYIFKRVEETNNWCVLNAQFPPEFDTVEDLEITKKYL